MAIIKSQSEIEKIIEERMAQLPKVVQDAINSADVKKQLRALAESHKLHIDQCATLETEVEMTLMGIQDATELSTNLQTELGISTDEAASLAADISRIVFEPIRQELERGLAHPEAKEKEVSPEEAAKNAALQSEGTSTEAAPSTAQAPAAPVAAPTIVPATPPPPAPTEKAVRAPISSSYTARQASSERKTTEGDPYREPPA